MSETNLTQRFFFCPKCGGSLCHCRRGGQMRLTCAACGYVMYENPVVGVAAVILKDGAVLLGRRAKHSTYPGLWCIPCGYVEYHEDVYDAIKRELREETGLIIEVDEVCAVLSNFHNPETHTVGIWFYAHAVGGELGPGDDIDAVAFFGLHDVPPLAFPTDKTVVELLRGRPGERKNPDILKKHGV